MSVDLKKSLKICGCIFGLFLCIFYWQSFVNVLGKVVSAAAPLILGAVIAFVVNILMTKYEKWFFPSKKSGAVASVRRPLCMILAFLSAICIIALVIWLILPQLVLCIQTLLSSLPGLINNFINKVNEWEFIPDDILDTLSDIDWKSRIEQIVKTVMTGIGGVVNTLAKTVMSLFSGIVTAIIGIIFSFYLLIEKDNLKRQLGRVMKKYVKDNIYKKIIYVFGVLNDSFRKFIVGQLTEAVILGVLCTIGMLIFNFPYATMIGALIAFTALIPIAGAYIGAITGAVMIMTVSPMKALGFLVFILILQQLEGNIIYPRVVGSSIGLPGIWVLAAVTVGGGVFGVGGMLIGVPLTSALYKMLRDDLNKADLSLKIGETSGMSESSETYIEDEGAGEPQDDADNVEKN